MAVVTIYAEHRDILDSLISSGKVASVAGGTKTGPFKDQRDAYVFAASIAFALNAPTPGDAMPKSRKDSIQIRDTVFLNASGARELAIVAAMTVDPKDYPEVTNHTTIDECLNHQLSMILSDQMEDWFTLLDRFAHSGFRWLAERRPDESSIRDLMLSALTEIDCIQFDDFATEPVKDALLFALEDNQSSPT